MAPLRAGEGVGGEEGHEITDCTHNASVRKTVDFVDCWFEMERIVLPHP